MHRCVNHLCSGETLRSCSSQACLILRVSFSAFPLNRLFQRSSGNSDLAPDAHHFTPSGPVSRAKWCTSRALWMPASSFLIFLLLFHNLSPFYLSVSTFSWNSLCLRANKQAQKPRSACCLHHPTFAAILTSGHLNFLFLRRVQRVKGQR